MDSPGRNEDTPLKAKSTTGPPRQSTAHSEAKRDRQTSASNRALTGGKMRKMLDKDTTECKDSDNRVPMKRDRNGDFLDSDAPAIRGASYLDAEDEPPRKRGRQIEGADPEADPEAVVTKMERAEFYGESDDPEASTTFVIYSGDDRPQSTLSLLHDDIRNLKTNLKKGGRVGSIQDPAAAVTWLEEHWEDPLLVSIRRRSYGGPFAQMLFLTKPALALFGPCTDKVLRDLAESLRELSGFPVVIRPTYDAPKRLLTPPEIGYEGSARDSSYDGQPEATDREHRTQLTLRINKSHTHAVDIRYNLKFPDSETGHASSNPTSSHSEVIALVDLRIKTRPGQTEVDRSYASFGFLAHREQSIQSLRREPDFSDKLYKHGVSTSLEFPGVEAMSEKSLIDYTDSYMLIIHRKPIILDLAYNILSKFTYAVGNTVLQWLQSRYNYNTLGIINNNPRTDQQFLGSAHRE
ncbi:hypothetical protein MVEN_01705200 [Mycena venus]|uniref:Uncharacterized protein n=1 Tax=Mycena venus TaxID=2733690 RepID=A0A8H6XPT0_9AGAR|nr:hypothetical protein MVEN_01705200 [Mycena venus]